MVSYYRLPLEIFALGVCLSRSVTAQSVTDYAPDTGIQCPDENILRTFSAQNQTLNPAEVEYVSTRQSVSIPDGWKSFVKDASGIGYNLSAFPALPKLGIAISGGGHRAAQYGAGVLSALDSRNESANAAGTGGLLQAASYISALSGGSWLTTSMYQNNFPTLPDLIFGNGNDLNGWLLDLDLFLPDGINIFSGENQAYFGSIMWSVLAKANKGLDTSITDLWSRALSFHFLNQTTRQNFFTNDSAHGAGQVWSQIPSTAAYSTHQVPFPLIVTAARPVGSNATGLSLNATLYEVSPLEFTSFDPSLSAGIPTKFTGTALSDGQPRNKSACVTNFDETGFIMGTSSSLFNKVFDDEREDLLDDKSFEVVKHLLARLLDSVRTRDDDVANWPNPFKGIAPATFQDSTSDWLEMIDGGSNGEAIPLGALLVKARALDVIVAIDGTADDENSWPTGESLRFTANRTSQILRDSHQQFPPVPSDATTFVNAGFNQRPTFFGCNPSNNPPEYPLVIYLPNSPPLTGADPVTNTKTFKFSYTLKHTVQFLDQAHANAIGGFTPNSNSPDEHWGKCLQCAALDRARYTTVSGGTPQVDRSDICAQCFKQYCYDPNNLPSKNELPNRKLIFVDPDPQDLASFFRKHRVAIIAGAVAAVALLAAIAAGLWWLCKRRKTKYSRLAST